MQSIPTSVLFGLMAISVGALTTVICGTVTGEFRKFRGLFWIVSGATLILIVLGIIPIPEVTPLAHRDRTMAAAVCIGCASLVLYGLSLLFTQEKKPPSTNQPPTEKHNACGDPDEGG